MSSVEYSFGNNNGRAGKGGSGFLRTRHDAAITDLANELRGSRPDYRKFAVAVVVGTLVAGLLIQLAPFILSE